MGKSCCAVDCKNRFNKNSELSFYRLPKAKEKRIKWIAAICRNNWNPGPETWICSSHFVSGKKSDNPLHPDYVPSLFSFTSTTDRAHALGDLERFLRLQDVLEKRHTSSEEAPTGLLNLQQIKEEAENAHQIKEEVETMNQIKEEVETMNQIKEEVETMNQIKEEVETMNQIKEEVETMNQIKEEVETMNQIKEEVETMNQIKQEVEAVYQIKAEAETACQIKEELDTMHQIKEEVEAAYQVKAELETIQQRNTEIQSFLRLFQDAEVQTEERHGDIASLHEQVKSLNTECQSLRDKIHTLESELKRRTLDTSQFDDSKMKIFTGLPNLKTFMLLFSYVSSILPDTEKQSLKPTQELLLTLMKLRHNLSEKFLGQLFGIHQSTVSRIFRRWIHVMASRLPDSEFPLLKAAISQHVSPPGQAEGAHSAGKVTPAPVLYKT